MYNIYIYNIYNIYIYMSNLENPRFTECHKFAQKQYMENLGVSLAGKLVIYLTPERRLRFLFDSSLQDSFT